MTRKSTTHLPAKTASTTRHKARYFLLFLFFISYVGFSWYYKPFVIQEISCQLDENTACPEELSNALQSLHGKVMLSPFLEAQIASIAEQQTLQVTDITYHFPHDLNLTFQQETLLLQLSCISTTLSLSENGYLFTKSPDETLPQFTASDTFCTQLQDSQPISSAQLQQLQGIADALKADESSTQLFLSEDDQVKITLDSGQQILLTQSDFPRQYAIQKLLLVEEELTDDWSELDMRFDKPILRGGESIDSTPSAEPTATVDE